MEPLLQTENYSITFRQYDHGWNQREFSVVKNLNLKLYSGEVAAIVGASGSGKSLLAHGILGILPYNASTRGSLYYQGQELTARRIQALRGREIVLIPQSTAFLDPLMKVEKQILKGRKSPSAKKKMHQILEEYHLEPEVLQKYPFELSGGMTRRVLLTAARMEEPRLVIADEPTPGLHKELAVMALSHLREMADAGAGILLITHDLEQALAVADRVVVFWEGEAIEEAPTEAFAKEETLQHPYTRALWRAMPRHGFSCREETDMQALRGKETDMQALRGKETDMQALRGKEADMEKVREKGEVC